MKSLRKITRNRLGFEHLEQRQLLAGNVTADTTTNPGTLTIFGDNSSNVIVITQTAPNTFKITGGGTTINGTSSAKSFSNVTNGIFMNMEGGSDSVTLKNLNIQGEYDYSGIGLAVLLGDGNDALVITGVTTEYACGIMDSSGTNAIAITNSNFGYDLAIQTGNGVDAVVINHTSVDGGLSIQLGNGTNALTVNDLKVVTLDGGGGFPSNDLPDGFDGLNCIFLVDCGAVIDGGSGVDAFALKGLTVDCLTQIDTYGGNDSVAIVSSLFGDAPVVNYLSADSVDNGCETSGLCIETGLGSDAVAIVNTTVYGFLQIDTSGDICCPCADSGNQPETSSSYVNDGNDVVSLVTVSVHQSEEATCCQEWCDSQSADVSTDTSEWGCCCCCCCDFFSLESGMLLIYTGNQADAVALNQVSTDAEAGIFTTDFSNLDGNDAVAIVNSRFNRNDVTVCCYCELPYVTPAGLDIQTGDGIDAVSVVKVNVVGAADICTGGGTDAVVLNTLVADCIFADLGDGNYNALTVANCTATYETFDAGNGNGNTLVYLHLKNHFANPPQISGFDIVV